MANIMENIHILGGSYEEWANILGLQWNSVENFIKGQIFTSIHNDNLSVEQKRSILELTNESVIVNIVNTTQEQEPEPVTEPVAEETTETVQTTSSKPKKKKAKKAKKSKKTEKAPLNTLSNIEESVLKKYSAKELKAFLKTKKLLIKGNKAALVTRVFKAIMHPDQITDEDKPKKRGKKKKVQEPVANNTSLSDDEMELLEETSIEAVEETNQNVTEEDENSADTVVEEDNDDVEWNHSSTGMSSLFTDEENEDDDDENDDE